MGTLVYLICVAVASFAVLAQPAAAQRANTTLPITYPGQVLQGDGSQTCPSEVQRGITRSEVKNATQRLLRESVVPLLQTNSTEHPCGGSGWRRAVYLNMSDPSQQCPSVWQEITTPFRVCGRRSSGGSCQGLTYSTGSVQYNQVCGRIIGYQIGPSSAFRGSGQSINTYYVEGISVTHGSPPANTSGPLLLVLRNRHVTVVKYAPVSVGVLTETIFLHLWGRITFARQA